MADLDDYRKEIDKIDKELVELFEKRMDVVLKVAQFKKENNIQVFHKNREDMVLEKAVNNTKNKEYEEVVKKFMKSAMDIGKIVQRQKISDDKNETDFSIVREEIDSSKKIGFPGVVGSFTEEAAIKFFGEDINTKSYEDFEDIFKAIENNEIDYGIVPIENSSTGAISENYDNLRKYGFFILGEECIRIDQHLVGIKGTRVQDIKEIYSHPQGIEQSSEFLKPYKDGWKMIPFHNTATSAKFVKDSKDKTKAAIASSRAAKFYDLDIIESCINNQKENFTRFIIIAKELKITSKANKVSVVFSLENEAGTLYSLLRYFAENDINMIKIESRPIKDDMWKYFLYVDFEGDIESKEVQNALKLIDKNSAYFKLLGAYEKK